MGNYDRLLRSTPNELASSSAEPTSAARGRDPLQLVRSSACVNANAEVRETSRQLYAVPNAAFLHHFPSHLKYLNEQFEHQLGAPSDLVLLHTLLGYFLANQNPKYC